MKIKTFRALTMQDALRAIKAELGSDAVILSAKQVRAGGALFGLFGRPMVQVAAAIDYEPVPRDSARPRREHAGAGPASRAPAWNERGQAPRPAPQTEALPRFDGELRRSIGRKPPPPDGGGEPPAGTTLSDIRAELARLRTLIETSASGAGRTGAGVHTARDVETLPPPVLAARDRLVRAGLSAGTALQLAAGMAERGRLAELDTEAKVRDALHRRLVKETRAGGPLLDPGEWKKTVMLVGPTGVGKTTTIAKLAAHFHVKEKRSVSLITMDTYRVAAVEQLRLFAKTIGVSLEVALTKEEMLAFVRRRPKTELILIDTPGRSPLDAEGMEELRQTVETEHPLETHLVLSATTRDEDLQDAVERYAALPINRLLFTKLDETTRFGAPFEVMRRTGWPLSYLSTGQNVPEDLELVSPDRMAELLLDGDLRPRRRVDRTAPPPARSAPPEARPAAPQAKSAGPEARSAAPQAKSSEKAQAGARRAAQKGGSWWTRW